MQYYIGVDLGGSNIAAGLVDLSGRILFRLRSRTNSHRGAGHVCDEIASLCRLLLAKAKLGMDSIRWVGVGSPGIIHNGVVRYANNLNFREVPLSRLLSERLCKKVYLQNDANAAAFGEFIFGAGRGHHSLVAVTLGTGVGGGIIHDHRILTGFNGTAGELGHIVIHAGGRPCSCGRRGCFEAYCCAPALKAAARKAMNENPDSEMWRLCGGNAAALSGKAPFEAAALGDRSARQVVEEYLFYLSLGLSNLIEVLQPQVLCLGGGISREGDRLILPLRKLVSRQMRAGESRHTDIVTAQLGNDAGLVGAAMLGRQQ